MKSEEFLAIRKGIDPTAEREGMDLFEYFDLMRGIERLTDRPDHYECLSDSCCEVFEVSHPVAFAEGSLSGEEGMHVLLATSYGKFIHCPYSRGDFTFINRVYTMRGFCDGPSYGIHTRQHLERLVAEVNAQRPLDPDRLNVACLHAPRFGLRIVPEENGDGVRLSLPSEWIQQHQGPSRLLSFEEIVNWFGMDQMRRLFRFPARMKKKEMMATLRQQYADPRRVQQAVKSLSFEGRTALRLMMRRPDGQDISSRLWDRYLGIEVNTAINELLQAQLTIIRPRGIGQYLPAEVADRIAPAAIAGDVVDLARLGPGPYRGYGQDQAKRVLPVRARLAAAELEDGSRLAQDVAAYLKGLRRGVRVSERLFVLPISTVRRINATFALPEELGAVKKEHQTRRFLFVDYFARELGLVDDEEGKAVPTGRAFDQEAFFHAWLDDIHYNELFLIPTLFIVEQTDVGRRGKKKAEPFLWTRRRREAVWDVVLGLPVGRWVRIGDFLAELRQAKGFFVRRWPGWECFDLELKRWLIDQCEWERVEGRLAEVILEHLGWLGRVSLRFRDGRVVEVKRSG